MIHYFEGQTEENRADEIRKFKLVCPEYYDCPENLVVLKQYLAAKDLPILTDTLAAGFLLSRNNLIKKPIKLRTDDSNAPGRTGRMTTAEKQEDERKIAQANEDRKAAINKVARQRERREAETRINQYQEYTNGKVNHAKTQTARQRMLAELDKSNPREV
jgi:hypothetical protein